MFYKGTQLRIRALVEVNLLERALSDDRAQNEERSRGHALEIATPLRQSEAGRSALLIIKIDSVALSGCVNVCLPVKGAFNAEAIASKYFHTTHFKVVTSCLD